MLILTNSGLAYHFYQNKINEDEFFGNDNLCISPQKDYGYYIIEQKQQTDYQLRHKDLAIKFNFKICKTDLKIKSRVIPTIYIRKYLAKISSQSIFKDFRHAFPFHYFY
jgi:hypothetical protein